MLTATWLVLSACEKTIEVELPPYSREVVVEGNIEEGSFPLVLLTRSQGYYDPVNAGIFSSLFISDAKVSLVVDGSDTVMLDIFCTADLPDSLRKLAAELLNLPTEQSVVNICVYTSQNPVLLGKAGSTYELLVNHEGRLIRGITSIPEPVPLDTLYFKPDGGLDSLGFLYSNFREPLGPGQAYRCFAQRINHYTFGENAGEQKDLNFIAPFGSVFDDEFIDGEVVEFAFNRGRLPGSQKEDDNNAERGFFKSGDTVVVKFTTIDRGVYEYYRSFYNSIGSSGSPFASPANVVSNVSGARGVWAGYGIFLDTLVVP